MTRYERYFNQECKKLDRTLMNMANNNRAERKTNAEHREEESRVRAQRKAKIEKARGSKAHQFMVGLAETPTMIYDSMLGKYAAYTTLSVEEQMGCKMLLMMCIIAAVVMWSIECCPL